MCRFCKKELSHCQASHPYYCLWLGIVCIYIQSTQSSTKQNHSCASWAQLAEFCIITLPSSSEPDKEQGIGGGCTLCLIDYKTVMLHTISQKLTEIIPWMKHVIHNKLGACPKGNTGVHFNVWGKDQPTPPTLSSNRRLSILIPLRSKQGQAKITVSNDPSFRGDQE